MNDSLKFTVKTDQDGLFRLQGLTPGRYQFMVYKKGFSQFKNTEWIVAPGKNPFREVHLNKKILKGRLIEIKPPKTGGAKSLLAHKRQSGLVIEGVSAEQISKSTDSDAGAIARRVTGTSVVGGRYVYVRGLGERYTNMTLNSLPVPTPEKDKRVVPQDLFPASVIENFIIYKTISPELITDFAGGSINLVTKGVPDKSFLKISVSGGAKDYPGDGGFLNLGEDRLSYERGAWAPYFFGYGSAGRRIPNGVPKIVTQSMDRDSLADIAQKFNNHWGLDTASVFINQSYSAAMGRVFNLGENERTGFLGHISIKNKYDQREQQKLKVGIAPLQRMVERRYELPDTVLVLEVPVTVYDSFPSEEAPSGMKAARLQVIQRGVEQRLSIGSYKATTSAMLNWGYENPDNNLWFKSLYANIADDKTIYNYSRKDSNVLVSLGQEDDVEERFLLEYQRRSILTGQLGGGHFLGFSILDSLVWAGGISRTLGAIPDSRKYFYIRRDSTTLEYDAKPPYGTRQFDEFNEFGTAGRFDFFWVIPPSLSKKDVFLKEGSVISHVALPKGRMGALTNYKTRKYDIIRYAWESDIIDNALLKDTNNNYNLVEDIHHPDSVYKRVVEKGSGFRSSFNDYDNYQAREYSAAGYFSCVSSLKLLRFPADISLGGRYEFFSLKFKAPFTGDDRGGDKQDIDISNSGFYFYPSTSVGFEFLPKTKFRFLYSQTLVRPEVRERAPLFFFDSESEIEVIGNPELEDTRIKNYDLRLDWFLPYNQLFSVSGFYKDFQDPIEYIIDYNLSPNRKKFQNAGRAYVKGIEFEINLDVHRLTSRLAALDGLQFYANAAWMKSRVSLDTSEAGAKTVTSKTRSLMGQSPYLYNCKLTHEKKWNRIELLNALLFNVSGPRIHSLGVHFVSDTYEEPFPSLDFLSKLTLGMFQISFKLQNILNAEKQFTIREYNHEKEYHSISNKERDELYADKTKKYVINRYDPGISYSLGISAKF
jgi:hypothetical protein